MTWTMQRRLYTRSRIVWLGTYLCLLCSSSLSATEQRKTPLVQAVKRVELSVVNIHTEKTSRDLTSGFGQMANRKVNGMGTGIIVDERGYIVTNQHVVADVDLLRVTLQNGRTFQGEAISYDPKHDLAIIKINSTEPLPVAPFGTSADLMLGETVIAVGNAFGYEHTVTSGIVSALSRDVEVNEKQGYKNLIQTDASINPGNSGGPLLNLDGEVIGINVAIRAGAQRIGFAIPMDDARIRIAKLLNINHLSETWHGMVGRDIKQNVNDMRLIVQANQANSPAELAGFVSGDVVSKVGGMKVRDQADFERALLGRAAGEKVTVDVLRGGQPTSLELELSRYPGAGQVASATTNRQVTVARANNTDPNDDRIWQVYGVRIAPVGANQVQHINSKLTGGLMVTEVRSDSPASKERIQRGDILWGLGRYQVTSGDEMVWILDNVDLANTNPLKFFLIRQNKTLQGNLALPVQVAQQIR